MAEQSRKSKQGQTLLTHFISKKQMTSPLETTASVLENLGNVLRIAEHGEELGDANSASPIEVIELEIPDTQNMYELADQMPKMNTSNHKMNRSWFGEFSWLKLAEDRKSLYCMTCFGLSSTSVSTMLTREHMKVAIICCGSTGRLDGPASKRGVMGS